MTHLPDLEEDAYWDRQAQSALDRAKEAASEGNPEKALSCASMAVQMWGLLGKNPWSTTFESDGKKIQIEVKQRA
jgi:hypothetical protein